MASPPLVILRRGFQGPSLLGRTPGEPHRFLCPLLGKEPDGGASLGEGKQSTSSSLSPISSSNGWHSPSPFVLDWVDALIYPAFTFLSIWGSGGFYSLWLTQHAPQWRDPSILSISIALGNVFNDIWWLKARCSRPMIKKLMIKAL